MISFFSGKKIVITGATGFIGSRLAKELLQQGAYVTVLARKNSDLWRIRDYVEDISWAYPDFDSFDALLSQLERTKPDFIYHLATYYSSANNVDLSAIIDANIRVGAMLVKAAAAIDSLKLLVNVGTCAEYGDIRDKANEESRLAPTTIYASTKAASTIILHQMADDLNVPLTTLRLYNLYGEFERADRIVPYIILSMLNNKDVELTSCEQEKDYSYVGDFAKAFLQAAIDHEQAKDKLFNIGSGETIKIRQLVDEIAANLPASEAKIKFGAVPYRENEMWYQSTSIERAKKYLDWRPETSLQEGIKKTVAWYESNWQSYYG